MAVLLHLPINIKIALPLKEMAAGFMTPILKPLRRGPMTAGTILHDRIALHKSLFLCPQCVTKMGGARRLKQLGYAELRAYHGYGLCDGTDQEEQPCAMWMWEGSAHIQHQNEAAQWEAVMHREREAHDKARR